MSLRENDGFPITTLDSGIPSCPGLFKVKLCHADIVVNDWVKRRVAFALFIHCQLFPSFPRGLGLGLMQN